MKVSQNSELIAKRWAKALMELANENQGISKVDILDDLKEVDENIRSSAELSNVINKVGVGASMAVSGNLQNIAAILAILPLAVIYIFAQRSFVESIDNAGIVG